MNEVQQREIDDLNMVIENYRGVCKSLEADKEKLQAQVDSLIKVIFKLSEGC